MKITRNALRRIIREELSRIVEDQHTPTETDMQEEPANGPAHLYAFSPELMPDDRGRLTISPVTSFTVYDVPAALDTGMATHGDVDIHKIQGNFCESAYRAMGVGSFSDQKIMGFSPDGVEVVFGNVVDYGFPNSVRNKSSTPYVTLDGVSLPMFVSEIRDRNGNSRIREVHIHSPYQEGGCGYDKIGQPSF